MIYAQIKGGRKLHLAMEAGEEFKGEVVRRGFLSAPVCGQRVPGRYRMTINVPLGNACKNCRRVIASKRAPTVCFSAASSGVEG